GQQFFDLPRMIGQSRQGGFARKAATRRSRRLSLNATSEGVQRRAKGERRTAVSTPRHTSYIFFRCPTDKDRCPRPSLRGPLAARFPPRLRPPCAPVPVRGVCGAGRPLPCRPL